MRQRWSTVFLLETSLVFLGPAGLAGQTSQPEYGIEIREAWIAMPDGVRLAADLYMPTGGVDGERFPVLLEYLPYRKDDSRPGRYQAFSYFVQRGYVVARVDIRGTGNSEGRLIEYEYTDQEQEDGEVVIDWLSKQAFSTGRVGMFGISWGGFNSIQMAMRRPPALRTIIALMATDDIYQDDVHFTDGIMRLDAYEMGQDLANALPGAPDFIIDEDYYRDRFDTTPWLLIYKRQQRDGPFWGRGSLNRDYSKIDIPTFVIGGWYDGYRDSVPRMLENMKAPVKAIMGPWNHTYPNSAEPPPAVEWRHEAVRWFDHWLKDRDTGIMDEPRFAVFMREWHPPGTGLERIPGEWQWEKGWPLEASDQRTLYLHDNHEMSDQTPSKAVHQLSYVPTVGPEASGSVMWWGDWAPDQRPVDTYSLVYESEPMEDEIRILGFPHARLNVSADAPLAHWITRLSDVAPDGRVTQVAGAAMHGAQRDSTINPQPLTPGRDYPIDVELHFTSWVFAKGHRIRLAVNNAQWPMFWPTPYRMTTTLRLGGEAASNLALPVVAAPTTPTPQFLDPATDPVLSGYRRLPSETVSNYAEIKNVVRNERDRTTSVTATNSGGSEFPWGTKRYTQEIVHQAADEHPEATTARSKYTITVELPNRTLRWEGILEFESDALQFHYRYTRRLLEDGLLLREKHWNESYPRDLH